MKPWHVRPLARRITIRLMVWHFPLELGKMKITCCFLPEEANVELHRPGMSNGDMCAWIDRHGCNDLATQEISDPSKHPCDGTTYACDSHAAAMTCPGDVVHRFATPGVWP